MSSSFPKKLIIEAFLLFFFFTGCSYFEGMWYDMTKPDEEDLVDHINAFNKLLKWGQYAKAKVFIREDQQPDYAKYVITIEESLKVDDFSVEDIEFHDDGTASPGKDQKFSKEGELNRSWARVTIGYRYYKLPSNIFRKVVQEQIWEDVEGQWMLNFTAGNIKF